MYLFFSAKQDAAFLPRLIAIFIKRIKWFEWKCLYWFPLSIPLQRLLQSRISSLWLYLFIYIFTVFTAGYCNKSYNLCLGKWILTEWQSTYSNYTQKVLCIPTPWTHNTGIFSFSYYNFPLLKFPNYIFTSH